MATKDDNLHLELKHLQSFCHFLEDEVQCWQTFRNLANRGYLQISTMFENAIANCNSKITVTSSEGKDFSDGSDAKLSSVRTSSYGEQYSAPISNLHSKIGMLRVQVYERKQEKFYYFAIPYHAYKHIPKTSNIEIPFCPDGTPRRRNRCNTNWWRYEVPTFEDMAKEIDSKIDDLTEVFFERN